MASEPTFRIQALSIFEGAGRGRYSVAWEEDLFSAWSVRELVVECGVCKKALKIRASDAIAKGGKLDPATRGALARFRTKHDGCEKVEKKPKTKGAQQLLPGL